jgi:16S rRNA (guanine527-N7)-methyltransferase
VAKLALLLAQGLEQLALNLSCSQQQQLLDYLALLGKWNRVYNLTAIDQAEVALKKHILDSLSIYPYLSGQLIIDVGTGAGLPCIPLAIADPDKKWIALDANGKKLRFVFQACVDLNLTRQVRVVNNRAADYQPEPKLDTVVMRAFAPLPRALTETAHLLSPGGCLLVMQGRYLAAQAAREFSLSHHHAIQVPGLNEQRHLLVINKLI